VEVKYKIKTVPDAFQYLLGILVLCSFSVSALVTDADIQEKSLDIITVLSMYMKAIFVSACK
jgi:uncharacterized protein YcsI (UPF0317 family)